MVKRMIGVALVCLLAAGAGAQTWAKKDKEPEKSKGWMDDFAKATSEAAAFKQPVFALFTGSDWCPWCVKLEQEVFQEKAFKSFAEANLILFVADFPNGKKVSDKVKKQNQELKAKYGIRGFPSVLLLDAEGKVLAQTGYQAGGAEAYVKHVKELLEKAGVKTVAGAEAEKPLSAYEKMKAQKAAQAEAKK